MPPPDPKSRTTSPGFNSASAVGLPQPSEARTAASGSCPTCPASYRFPVIGSQQDTPEGDDPQQAVPAPLATRRAASPYFCFTTSVILSMLMISPWWRCGPPAPGQPRCCACSILHTGTSVALAAQQCSPCSGGTCPRALPGPALRSSICRDDGTDSSWTVPVRPEFHRPLIPRDVP